MRSRFPERGAGAHGERWPKVRGFGHASCGGHGDTMEMMRAVLDSNFWLATHVVAITIGYRATFLAGALAIGIWADHCYVTPGSWRPL